MVGEDEDRFPKSGWIEGSVGDLAELVRLVSVPQRAVEEAADALQKGIERAASVMDQLHESRPDVMPAIAGLLGMADVKQTRRMAGAIIANAMVFHERLGGMHGVKPLSQLCAGSVVSPKREILDAWTEILKINYWPIFAIARDIVDQIPAGEAAQLLTNLRTTVEDVAATGANQAHDLTGRIFQRLIADRKYLATFYTLPSSAALLARLAVAKLCPEPAEGMDFDWSDADAIGKLRIGDFACGTGALLSAVYDQIAVRHEQAGGDLAALHPVMMEDVLYGCDVMPSAIHITGSTLSGAQPTVGFGNTRLYTLAYGRQEDGPRPYRLPGASPVLFGYVSVQRHQPRLAHRKRGSRDRHAGYRRRAGPGIRPHHHEPALHPRHEPRGRARRRDQPRFRRVRSDTGRPDRDGGGESTRPARRRAITATPESRRPSPPWQIGS